VSEHRKLPRWQINRKGALKLDQAEEVVCQVKDINYKGAGIILNTNLPLDAEVKIQLQLTPDCSIDAQAWIVWHKVINGTNHYGIYFSRIKDVDKDKIFKFINMFHHDDLKQRCWSGIEKTAAVKGGEDMDDNRVFERFKKEFSARFIGLDGKEGQAQTFDISAKGLGLVTNNELTSKAPLEIWLDVPSSSDPLYTRGQVIWSKLAGAAGFRSGVELERADLMGISRLLRA